MPFTAKGFKERHNRKLTAPVAKKAAKQANAMLKSGVPEGVAIATANKRANKLQKSGKAASGIINSAAED